MKNIHKTLAITGVNLIALGTGTADATTLQVITSASGNPGHVAQMSEGQLRAIEASHLEIFPTCKWGHAAFDPVQVASETLAPEVQSLYQQMS